MLDRAKPFRLPPFNIEGVNREFAKAISDTDLICIGSYSFDRSMVCIDRMSIEITCFVGKDFTRRRKKWQTLEDWIVSEIERVGDLHDDFGSRLVNEKLFLPEARVRLH